MVNVLRRAVAIIATFLLVACGTASSADAPVKVHIGVHASLVLSHVDDGVFLVDQDEIIRLWNPAAETITGLSARDVIGRPVREAIPSWEVGAAEG